MDLERCPKCGNAWQGGDKCRTCLFVPIGAGLDKLPKKKKKKAKKYVEPGSTRGLMNTTLACGLGYMAFVYQPWKDDWELVRSLVGQGRHHSVVGEWQIKGIRVVKAEQSPINTKGLFTFDDKGKLKVDLKGEEDKTTAEGAYQVSGTNVKVSSLTTTASGGVTLPSDLAMTLIWTGPDKVSAAVNGSELVQLERHKKGNPLASIFHLGLKPGNIGAPGEMRGTIASMRDNIAAEEKNP